MPRSFSSLRDCLGKSNLPKRAKKAILHKAQGVIDTKGGTEKSAALAVVQQYHDLVEEDLLGVVEASKSATAIARGRSLWYSTVGAPPVAHLEAAQEAVTGFPPISHFGR